MEGKAHLDDVGLQKSQSFDERGKVAQKVEERPFWFKKGGGWLGKGGGGGGKDVRKQEEGRKRIYTYFIIYIYTYI
jgi:hypothetical protein